MPTFLPFAGLRYDLARLPGGGTGDGGSVDRTTALGQVIAPPYDVIRPAERERLAKRSPYNVVQLELPVGDATAGLNAYQHAARLLGDWRGQGILRCDPDPAFYGYAMSFRDGTSEEQGASHRTVGVIGALALAPPGKGDVLPHELTMPKPRSDRLDLLRACRANLSPVWGLSLAPGLSQLCLPPPAGATSTAVDDDGVTHQLWAITDPRAVSMIKASVGSGPIVIADGHHRYETALAYQAERRSDNNDQPGGHDFIMALVVELTDEQLSVRPIHRLLSGLPGGFDLAAELGRFFDVTPAEGQGRSLASEMDDHGALALVTPDGTWLARPTASTLDRAGADLDSSRLDMALAGLPPHQLEYQHGLGEALDAIRSGRAQAAVMLRPASVAVIAETARQRRRMPPKTTLFWPKPRTGMVVRPLDA